MEETGMTVTLDKSLGGLGLSITGGSDNQVKVNNSNIYITKVGPTESKEP